jgi:hypothetical protein
MALFITEQEMRAAARHADQYKAARVMLAALEASLNLIEKADADSGCIAYMERAQKHRAAIAAARAAGIKSEG